MKGMDPPPPDYDSCGCNAAFRIVFRMVLKMKKWKEGNLCYCTKRSLILLAHRIGYRNSPRQGMNRQGGSTCVRVCGLWAWFPQLGELGLCETRLTLTDTLCSLELSNPPRRWEQCGGVWWAPFVCQQDYTKTATMNFTGLDGEGKREKEKKKGP